MITRMPQEDPIVKSLTNRNQLVIVVAAWLVLSMALTAVAKQNASAPGLYYDEAVFAGLAKDFIAGHRRLHMPGTEITYLCGRPFPVFVQFYLGALKSWMLMPGLAISGFNLAAVRMTNWCWSSLTLLVFMLAVRRCLGPTAAVISGTILICDPVYFFLSLVDWGGAISALLCRCLAFYLAVLWWQKRKPGLLWLASFFLGVGLFNKFDFAAFIVGMSTAALVFHHSAIFNFVRQNRWTTVGCWMGFLLGTGPMLFKVPWIVRVTSSGQNGAGPGEITEKLHTLLAMYDGSYFYRLMDAGGLFSEMYGHGTGVHSLFGVILIASLCVLVTIAFRRRENDETEVARFLLVAFAVTTIAELLVPGAVRIHHSVLVFPLPQLMIAVAAISLWQRKWQAASYAVRGGIVVLLALLVTSQLFAVCRTDGIVSKSGGRGWWSSALDQFCHEIKDRADLTVISLDWGFNEQVSFLTDAPQLAEPVWAFPSYKLNLPPLPLIEKNVYLAHSPAYSLMRFDISYLEQARNAPPFAMLHPYFDAEGRTVFYSIQFPQ